MKKTVAIIQARMNSTRLPSKILMDLCGKPILWHIINRLSFSNIVDSVVVATTENEPDDAVEAFCKEYGFNCFRGSEDDVLDRFYAVAKDNSGDVLVRITADCPLVDPMIVDQLLKVLADTGADYVSNTNPPTYPDGMDVEVFSFECLEKAWNDASLKYQREHVTSYITEHPEMFSIENVSNTEDLSDWRLTVDEKEDFELITNIYNKLYKQETLFNFHDIIAFLSENKDLLKINDFFARNDTYDTNDK